MTFKEWWMNIIAKGEITIEGDIFSEFNIEQIANLAFNAGIKSVKNQTFGEFRCLTCKRINKKSKIKFLAIVNCKYCDSFIQAT